MWIHFELKSDWVLFRLIISIYIVKILRLSLIWLRLQGTPSLAGPRRPIQWTLSMDGTVRYGLYILALRELKGNMSKQGKDWVSGVEDDMGNGITGNTKGKNTEEDVLVLVCTLPVQEQGVVGGYRLCWCFLDSQPHSKQSGLLFSTQRVRGPMAGLEQLTWSLWITTW